MRIFICLLFGLLFQFAQAQTISTQNKNWQTTIQMGVQLGRVQPDNSPGYYGGYYYGYTTVSSQTREPGNRIGLTIHTFTGYRLNSHLVPGLSLGLDYYNNSAFIPLAGAIQGDLLRRPRRITPFYTFETGYALAGPNPHGKELKGGWLLSPGVGLRINKGNGTGFLLSAGYKHQEARHVALVDGAYVLSQVEQRYYNRIYFRMGFSF